MINEREYWAIIIGAMAFGFMYAAAKDLWKGLTGKSEMHAPPSELEEACRSSEALRAGSPVS
jgi:hypothetical protein